MISAENHLKQFKPFLFVCSFEPTVSVNQRVQTRQGFRAHQIVAQHQHGLFCSHNTPSVCSPVVPARQVLPSASSLWNTCVSVRLSPEFFSPHFRNVVSACYRSTKSCACIHQRSDSLSCAFVAVLTLYPPCRGSAQQRRAAIAAATQSAETPSCKQTISRYGMNVSFSSHNSSRATEFSRSAGESLRKVKSL